MPAGRIRQILPHIAPDGAVHEADIGPRPAPSGRSQRTGRPGLSSVEAVESVRNASCNRSIWTARRSVTPPSEISTGFMLPHTSFESVITASSTVDFFPRELEQSHDAQHLLDGGVEVGEDHFSPCFLQLFDDLDQERHPDRIDDPWSLRD